MIRKVESLGALLLLRLRCLYRDGGARTFSILYLFPSSVPGPS